MEFRRRRVNGRKVNRAMLALSLPALLLGLGCGVLYSASDTFRKAVPASCPPETIFFYYIGGQIPVLAAWLAWTGTAKVAGGYILPGAIDAACGLAANFLFIIAIRRSPLSLMVPLLALVPVLTLIFGGLSLGEWPGVPQCLGILLIAAGLFALFQPPAATPGLRAAWTTLKDQRGSLPMLAVVLLWSVTPALDKMCLAHTSASMHSLIQVSLIWGALLVLALIRGLSTVRLPAGARAPVAAAAVAGGLGYACQLAAYSIAMVALIEVLKRTVSLLSALVLGRAAFREPLTAAKIAGIAVIAAGLPLVMLS
jgi:drug/metabolite transporter (DMT)-like permease